MRRARVGFLRTVSPLSEIWMCRGGTIYVATWVQVHCHLTDPILSGFERTAQVLPGEKTDLLHDRVLRPSVDEMEVNHHHPMTRYLRMPTQAAPYLSSSDIFSVRRRVIFGFLLLAAVLWGPSHASAQDTETQQISLEQGENFVSLRVQPEDASIDAIFGGYLDQIHRVNDEKGRVYMPAHDIEQFTTWEADKSYKVYASSSFDVEVTGSLISASVPLEKGGNLIPYLLDSPQDVDQALASVSETLIRIEDEEGNAYEPGGSPAALDSLHTGQGYTLYVDQADTLVYPIQAETLMDALTLEGVEPGRYVHVEGRNEPTDGGGGTFVVTNSACETDGGTCFIFEENLTQVTGASSITHTNLSWRSVEIEYGSDPEDVIDMRHLNGFHGNRSAEFTPWIDLKNGDLVDYGWSIFQKIEDNYPDFDGFAYTYGHASSDRRLERLNIENSVRPEWWGAPRIDPSNPQEADSYLRWALIAARRIYKNPDNSYDRVWVDIEDGFYFLNELKTPGGTGLRGIGSTNGDGYTKGRLAIKPGEALFYHKVGYDRWEDDNRHRVYNHMLGLEKGVVTNGYEPNGGLEFQDLWIDGNVRNNMDVFNNPDDYEFSNGDSIFQWLQDSGDWSGFYTKGNDIIDGELLSFEDVRMEDLGASGLAVGRFDDLWDIQTSNLHIKDTRRNHLLYGPTGNGLDDITLEGQYWGGNPLYDPRGTTARSTYTNLTVKNIYAGQFGYNTIIASRGGGLDLDGFTIDLKSSSKDGGVRPAILAVEGLGNTFKNGTIEGYLPENYPLDDDPLILQQRGFGDGDATKTTLIDGLTVTDNGVSMQLAEKNYPTARQVVVKNFEYKAAGGVTGGGDIGTYRAPAKSSNPVPGDHAWRIYYENFDWKTPTEDTWETDAANGRLGSLPLDWYMVTGSVNNQHTYNRFLNLPGGVSYEAVQRQVRLFLNDFEIRTQTDERSSDNAKEWHFDLAPGNPVRLRNVTDTDGRVSENSGTYTSDADDEGNDFVLIDPNLISHPHQRSATVTNGTPSITSVEGAKPDGTAVNGAIEGNLGDAQEHVLRVNLDQSIQGGNTIDIDWSAQVTPDDAYQTTGLFVARKVVSSDGSAGLSFSSGFGSSTYDLRGVASSQESGEKIVYTASSGDPSVVTANVQSDDYTLELTEQGTGTATITVTGEIENVGTATTTFEVAVD